MVVVATETSIISRFDAIESQLSQSKDRVNLYVEPEFCSMLKSYMEKLLLKDGTILSFDIFDTLLLRDNSSELTRFIEIGSRMANVIEGRKEAKTLRRRPSKIPSKSAINAFLARHMGTKASYRARDCINGCREGSLSEIHRTASILLTGRSDYEDSFIESEIDYESTRLKKNQLLLDIAAAHRSRGGKVILITDMYMHADHVRTLFTKLGVDSDMFDLLVSSADTLESKASGGIFRIVQEQLGAPPDYFVHVGDSIEGDFRQPRRKGWHSLHLPISDTEIAKRRQDHQRSADLLRDHFSVTVDVAAPR